MCPTGPYDTQVRVAGIAVEGGKVYAAAGCPAVEPAVLLAPVDAGSRRFDPNSGLDGAHGLVDLTHRIEQWFRALRVSNVGLVETRKFSGLRYAEAKARITCVCAVMAACVECEIEFSTIKTSTIGKHIGVDAKSLEEADPLWFGFNDGTPTYWRGGLAKAYAAASVLLAGEAGA